MKLLGLDVGEKRIGVARADTAVRIAVPERVVQVDGTEIDTIVRLAKIHNIDAIIVGMPRNLQGEKTKQSAFTANFVKNLNKSLLAARPNNKLVKIFYQDESLTSVEARRNLQAKKGGIKKGDVDMEAATLILQDFLENLARRILEKKQASAKANQVYSSNSERSSATPTKNPTPHASVNSKAVPRTVPQFAPHPKSARLKWLILRYSLIVLAGLALICLSARGLYRFLLTAPVAEARCENYDPTSEAMLALCSPQNLIIPEGSSSNEIARLLKEAGLIRSTLALRVYLHLANSTTELKSGTYHLLKTSSVADQVAVLISGGDAPATFRFTSLPGETLNDVKQRLLRVGYTASEIEAAFNKKYNHPVLADKPEDASLEGYLFGETYEFYLTDSVETIIERMLTELYTVVEKNNLRDKFARLGLTLHEGIILASIVQKEAGTLPKDDQKTVAQVFVSRLNAGIPLGSDVTVKYALDLVDPERKTYTDNAAALTIDSCYNTRRNSGLPCGPISNPGALVLLSTANPADSSYLYFLTGDDGSMYYSYTESEHLQKITDHCQVLCATQL